MPEHLSPQRGPAAPATKTPSLKPSLPSHAPPAVKRGTQGGGQALDGRTGAEMSARFGHDFSSVRIHTDSRAGVAAGALGANAFALGSDIVFGEGQYQPGSSDTDRLLAHELTHVVQQSQWGGPGDWGRVSAKSDASEREADSLASQVMMGRSVSVQAAPGAAVARDGDDLDGGVSAPPAPDPDDVSLPGGVSTPPLSDTGAGAPPDAGPAPGANEGHGETPGWLDRAFDLNPDRSFTEAGLNTVLGPDSPLSSKPGDSQLATAGRALANVAALPVTGAAAFGGMLLDNVNHFPLGEMWPALGQPLVPDAQGPQ